MLNLKLIVFLTFTLCFSLSAVSTPAGAADPKVNSKKFFQKGIKFYNKGMIEEALIQFHKAFVAYPHWKIRKNIGLCYMNLEENVLALQELYCYLEEGSTTLKEKEKQAVMNVIFSVLEKVGIIRLSMLPSKSKVVLDGQINSETEYGKDIYVDPGLHVISVLNKKNQLLLREETYIAAGELKEIDISKVEAPIETTPEPASEIPGWKEVGPQKEKKLKVLHPAIFGVTAGLAVGIAGGAIGAGIKTMNLNNDFKNSTVLAKQDELKKEGQKYQRITNSLVAVSIGLAAVAVVLFFFTDFKKKKKKETMPTITLVPDLERKSLLLSAELRF